jgi:ubiquinone/menaquinone biosynthesis C-methylase UbiE
MATKIRAAVIALCATCAAVSFGQEKSVKPGINDHFQNPDVKEFIKKFETKDREVYAHREAIVAALGLRPGLVVADIGAGTGVFTRLMAERARPGGKVYAVDIAPAFLAHIAAESKRLGHDNVQTVRCTQDAVNLPKESIDLAFLCDAYHHLEYPAKSLASIAQALKPRGELVVVDFDRREGVSAPFVLEHVRASKEVFRNEIEAAGFELIEGGTKPALKETFFMRFRKKLEPAAPRSGAQVRQAPSRTALPETSHVFSDLE